MNYAENNVYWQNILTFEGNILFINQGSLMQTGYIIGVNSTN